MNKNIRNNIDNYEEYVISRDNFKNRTVQNPFNTTDKSFCLTEGNAKFRKIENIRTLSIDVTSKINFNEYPKRQLRIPLFKKKFGGVYHFFPNDPPQKEKESLNKINKMKKHI